MRTQQFFTTGAGFDTVADSGTPDKDNSNVSSLGILSYFGFGGSYVISRPLLRFDFSSLALVGREKVTRAVLRLVGTGSNAALHTTQVRTSRILPANAGWTAKANWNYAVPTTQRWAGDSGGDGGADAGCGVSGVDFSSTLLGGFTFYNDLWAVTEADLVVSEVLSMIAVNHGMVLWRPQSSILLGGLWSAQTLYPGTAPTLTLTIKKVTWTLGDYDELPMPLDDVPKMRKDSGVKRILARSGGGVRKRSASPRWAWERATFHVQGEDYDRLAAAYHAATGVQRTLLSWDSEDALPHQVTAWGWKDTPFTANGEVWHECTFSLREVQ